jgi:hypothetical protein
VVCGNSFSEDGFEGQPFDYMLANPPFGMEWKKVEDTIRKSTRSSASLVGSGSAFLAGQRPSPRPITKRNAVRRTAKKPKL